MYSREIIDLPICTSFTDLGLISRSKQYAKDATENCILVVSSHRVQTLYDCYSVNPFVAVGDNR